MSGRLVYVVGPSGAGKDSLMAWLALHWPRAQPWPALHLARRTITRPNSGTGEQHESVDTAAFERLYRTGQLALNWQANGVCYGIRHSELMGMDQGRCVLVNGSRPQVDRVRKQYVGLCVLHITARAETIQKRLLARGREPSTEVMARMHRSAQLAARPIPGAIEINNDGHLSDAGRRTLQVLATYFSFT